MSFSRILKMVHLASTGWLILAVTSLMVLALRQAGASWWFIFSLSGHSAVLILLLTSLYLFAIFRGVNRSQKIEIEHPLTSSLSYMKFYDVSPFLGAMSGVIGSIGSGNITSYLTNVAIGTLACTFLVWIVLDPLIGLIEMLLPAGKAHRNHRLARTKALHQKQKIESQRLVADIINREKLNQQQWRKTLVPQAEKLAQLIEDYQLGKRDAEGRALGLGAGAWKLGGITCMRLLEEMAMSLYNQKNPNSPAFDPIGLWWDGIGTWRAPSAAETLGIVA